MDGLPLQKQNKKKLLCFGQCAPLEETCSGKKKTDFCLDWNTHRTLFFFIYNADVVYLYYTSGQSETKCIWIYVWFSIHVLNFINNSSDFFCSLTICFYYYFFLLHSALCNKLNFHHGRWLLGGCKIYSYLMLFSLVSLCIVLYFIYL